MPFFQLRALVAALIEPEEGAVEAGADDADTVPTVEPPSPPAEAALDDVLTSLWRG